MLAITASHAASAQQLEAGADVRLSAEAVNNPYLDETDTGMTGAVKVEVRPWLRQQSALTSFDLSGFVQTRKFTDGTELEDNYGAAANLSHRVSERVILTGHAGIASTASRLNTTFPGLDPDPQTPVPQPLPLDPGLNLDPTLLGQRGRTTVLSGGIGTQYTIDERRSMQINLELQDHRFSHLNAQDYRTHGVNASLTQVIDPATNIGVELDFSQTDYASAAFGDARIVEAMGSVSHRLDERWTLEASAGASVARVEAAGPLARRESISVASSVSLCRREERGSLCLDYQRRPQPSGLGQLRNTDTAGLAYNLEWSRRNRLSVGASYSRSSGAVDSVNPISQVQLVSVRATLERAFNERVSGFVTASTSRVFRSTLAIEPQVNVGIGISIRLGRQG